MAAILALAVMLVPMSALAQPDPIPTVEVPPGGYSGTDTYNASTLWNGYLVHVERGHDLLYEFKVVGDGLISVQLSLSTDPFNYSRDYSTPQPVSAFSMKVPAYYGSDMDFLVAVNSSTGQDVSYDVSIHTEKASVGHYYAYYALIALGFVALAIFCWKFVVSQDRKERERDRKDRRKRKRG